MLKTKVEEMTPDQTESEAQLKKGSLLLQSNIREWWVTKVMQGVENFCITNGISPNMITMAALFFAGVCSFLFATGHILTAGWMVMFTGSLDFLDGRVARATNKVTAEGGFLDSVADRYQDFLLFAGLAYFYRNDWMFAIVLLALGGSMQVSYVRAKATNVGVDLSKVGAMQRPERMFMLGFGSVVSSVLQISLMPFWGKGNPPAQHVLILILIFMAISTNWTAVLRITHTMKALSETPSKEV